MKKKSIQNARELRKKRNNDILVRMDEGDSLSSFKSYASWFPPRPVLDKDPKAIIRLYGDPVDKRLRNAFSKATDEEGDAGHPRPLRLA